MTSLLPGDPRLVETLAAFSGEAVAPREPLDRPGFFETVGAAFQTHNVIASLLQPQSGVFAPDPDFDPFELERPGESMSPANRPKHLIGYESFAEAFVSARSLRDVQEIKSRIDRELAGRKILAEGGLLAGVASFAAGTLDPLLLIPVGGSIIKGARGVAVLRSAARTAAVAGGLVGAQEAVLHASQVTRTGEETAVAVTGATLLGGALGGALGALTAREARAAAAGLEAGLRAPPRPGTPSNAFTATTGDVLAGRASDPLANGGVTREEFAGILAQKANSTATMKDLAKAVRKPPEVVGAFGVEHAAKYLSPRLQLFMSTDTLTREVADQLIQSPVRLTGVKAFDAETAVRMRRAEARVAMEDVRTLYAQYVTGDPAARVGFANRVFGFRRRLPDRMRWDEFQIEVARAMRGEAGLGRAINVDIHDVPEVQQAARILRDRVINPPRDELIHIGLMPEKVKNFPGYLTRLYNGDRLRQTGPGGREGFVDAIIQYEQELALLAGESFDESVRRISLNRAVDKILEVREGMLHPGDVPLRGPMLERLINVPDAVIEPWLVNNLERIVHYYVRSITGEVELAKRFGLVRARAILESRRASFVRAVRARDDIKAAMKVMRKADAAIAAFGGEKFARVLSRGRRGAARMHIELPSRKTRLNAIRKADTEEEAVKFVEKYETDLIAEFSTGDMPLVLDKVATRWKARVRSASKTDERKARSLLRQQRNDLENIRLARDEVRGMASLPADPTAIGPRLLRGLRLWTYLAIGGKIAASSIPDMALPLANRLLASPRVLGRVTAGLLSDWNSVKLAAEDAKLVVGPSELITNLRSSRMFDIEEDFLPRHRIDKGIETLSRTFSLANMMTVWNTGISYLSAFSVQAFIADAARTLRSGSPIRKSVQLRLEELGLSMQGLERISVQLQAHGGRSDMVPNLARWTDDSTRQLYRAAVYRAFDMDVIKGGVLDRPKLVRRIPGLGEELSKTFFFFMNFGMAATTRMMVRGLQYRDASFLSAFVFSVGIGMMAAWLKWKAGGQSRPPADSVTGWVTLGFRQSGFSGFIFDLDRYMEAASGGKASIGLATGTRMGRYYSPDMIRTAVLGLPMGHMVPSAVETAVGFADLDPEPADVRLLRRLMPLNNHFLTARMIDKLEDEAERRVRR